MPKLFLSYAHKDTWNFAHRLFFALELYIGRENLFWDTLIPPGPFPEHLKDEIEACDFFVAVMSPYAAREDGWCRKELQIAFDSGRTILPVKCLQFEDEKLFAKYQLTQADFSIDFEVGFRRLTGWLLGEPVSSWEYLGMDTDNNLLFQRLRDGHIPALIVKEAVEWMLVEYLWWIIDQHMSDSWYIKARPRTTRGLLLESQRLLEQAAQYSSGMNVFLLKEVQGIISACLECFEHVKDSDHKVAGQCATKVFHALNNLFSRTATAELNAKRVFKANKGLLYFEMAEKLRELILLHSRRSRYLY